MANKIINSRVQMKHDTSTNWALAVNFVPLAGEIVVYSDLNKFKIGDGVTTITNLPFSVAEINDMVGATASTDGQHGLVPAPLVGDQGKYLKGDGTWATADAIIEVEELPEISSANMKAIYKVPGKTDPVYGWVGTTVPNTGTVSSLYLNISYDISNLKSLVTPTTTEGDNSAYIFIATEDNCMLFCSFSGDSLETIMVQNTEGPDVLYNYEEGWLYTQQEINERLSTIFLNKNLISSYTVGELTIPVGIDNAAINGFVSTTEPTQEIIVPSQIVSYKYYSANALGWTNLNNQIEAVDGNDAIPNSGTADKVYFNTSLSIEEVVSILSNVTFIDGGMLYLPFSTTDYSIICMIQNPQSPVIMLYHGFSSQEIIFDASDGGWVEGFSGVVDLSGKILSDNVEGYYTVGTDNEKITDLCYVPGFKYVFKEFNGNIKDVITEFNVNGSSVIKNNKVELTLGPQLIENGDTGGNVVPNSGVGGKYYLNIDMEPSAVNALIDSVVDSTSEGYLYFAVFGRDGDEYYVELGKEEGSYSIYICDINGDTEVYAYSDSTGGWVESFDGIVDMTGLSLTSSYYTFNVGLKNSDIIDLFYTLPIPFTYSISKPDGNTFEIAENKDIIGSELSLTDVDEIAIGYDEDTYETINYISDVTDKTVLASSSITTTVESGSNYAIYEQETALTFYDLFINKVTFGLEDYYIPTKIIFDNTAPISVIGDVTITDSGFEPDFTNYPFAIISYNLSDDQATYFFTPTAGTYTIAITACRPSISWSNYLHYWFSPSVNTEKKSLKTTVSLEGYEYKLNEIAASEEGYFVTRDSDMYGARIVTVYDSALANAPLGTYWYPYSGDLDWVNLITNTEKHKIGAEYLEEGSALPPATSEDAGKVLQVNNTGTWQKGEVENITLIDIQGLPTVTSEDNGKILKVVNGVWTAVAINSAEESSF